MPPDTTSSRYLSKVDKHFSVSLECQRIKWAQTYRIQNWPSGRLKKSTYLRANSEFCTSEPFPLHLAERDPMRRLWGNQI